MQRLGTLLACGLLAITLGVGCAHPAKSYFGHIEATPTCKPGENGCADIFQMLRGLDDCKTVGECKAGEDILKAVFGTTYRPSVPDYIVYFEQGAKGFHFVKHNPVLMWGHENTPHVYGARDVYAVVFTERRACLSAHVTTIYRNDPNPFSGVLSVLGSKADPAAAKAPERTVGQFRWYPLSGDPNATGLWLGLARFAIDENSTLRITVEYSEPQTKKSSDGDKATSAQAEECTTPEPDSGKKSESKPAADGPGEAAGKLKAAASDPRPSGATGAPPGEPKNEKYSGDFLSANGFFSNSQAGWATVSFALGTSFDVRDTAVASGGSRIGLNGYAVAKVYLLRPRISVSPECMSGRRASAGLFVGTGVKSPFDEMAFGVSVGHLIGNVGVLVGANSIAGAKDSTKGRKLVAFSGIDYSF